MAKLYKYKFFCSTESAWKYVWAEQNETVQCICPTDTTHICDSGSLSVDKIAGNDAQVDTENANLSRLKYAPVGWAYQAHSIEVNTSTLSGVKNLKADGTSTGFATIKFYKADGTEITSGLQSDLDTLCVKTRVTWEPNHSIEVISGMVMNYESTAQNIFLNAIVAPHIPAAYGGSKVFVQSLNLKYIGAKCQVRTDGRASKHIAYDATNLSHRWQFDITHPAGTKHEILVMLEFYKA